MLRRFLSASASSLPRPSPLPAAPAAAKERPATSYEKLLHFNHAKLPKTKAKAGTANFVASRLAYRAHVAVVRKSFIAQTQAQLAAAELEAQRRQSLQKTQSQDLKDAKAREKKARAEWAARCQAVTAEATVAARAAAAIVRRRKQALAAAALARQVSAQTLKRQTFVAPLSDEHLGHLVAQLVEKQASHESRLPGYARAAHNY